MILSFDHSNDGPTLHLNKLKWKFTHDPHVQISLEQSMVRIITQGESNWFTIDFIYKNTGLLIGKTFTLLYAERVIKALIEKAILPFPIEELA